MQTRNLVRISVLIIITLSLYSCPQPTPELPGDITGIVTDAETSAPIYQAKIKLNTPDDTTSTGIDGIYLFKNITSGDYEIQASKFGFNPSTKNIEVIAADDAIANFALSGIPIAGFSDTILNFELDLTSLPFAIVNSGKGKLTYAISSSQDWIIVNPSSGDLTNESDTIRVTINKTDLSDTIVYKEAIKIISDSGTDSIYVIVNGFMYYGQVYKIVKIGTQTWMAENLNAGRMISNIQGAPRDNGIPEKFCLLNEDKYCRIYGGIYPWGEAMQYNLSDDGTKGTTQGICLEGWHIPTAKEWLTLADNLGGMTGAGGKMKETGYSHWQLPNSFATNESGFTALAGGYMDFGRPGGVFEYFSYGKDSVAGFWSATQPAETDPYVFYATHVELSYDNSQLVTEYILDREYSVRCIKDEKN